MSSEKKYIYCDNAATTQTRREVAELVMQTSIDCYGNSSSLHQIGKTAKGLLESSRESIASFINASPSEIYFTKNGTESNNLSIVGTAKSAQKLYSTKNHIITSAIEHSSVDLPIKKLEAEGYQITRLGVDKEGFIDIQELQNKFTDKTLLVSIIHGNNEIGTIQDIERIGELCKSKNILFHSDTVQSIGKTQIDVKKQNIDLLSISGHKLYGPKGIGVLYAKQGTQITPNSFGGGQESGLIPGTENIPAIVGLSKAIELRQKEMQSEALRLKKIQQLFFDELQKYPDIQINGTLDLSKRIPGNINFSFSNLKGEAAVLRLNIKGICASSGSACSSGSIEPSKVITALYKNQETNWPMNSVRLSFGLNNSQEEALEVLNCVKNLNKKSALI